MRALLRGVVALLLLAVPAVAQQNTDSQVQVNDSPYGQLPAAQLWVTPTGGSRMRLGDALAASGGCTTNCSFSNPTITGGTISGVTGTLTGHSTLDLALTGGALSGALSSVGFTDNGGGINTTAVSGYSIRGTSAFSVVGSPGTNTTLIAGFGAGTMVGSTAGAGAFSTFLGDSVGAVYTGAGEVLCAGSLSCAHLTTAVHEVALGIGALWWETTGGFNVVIGSDASRNAIGQTNNTMVGPFAGDNYFSSEATGIGFDALFGNAASLQISGAIGVGEVISGAVTVPSLGGSPFAYTYTTVSGDAVLATLASHICTAIGTINGGNTGSLSCIPTSAAFPAGAGTPAAAVVSLNWDGTSTQGNIIALTATTTGAEVLTIGGGSQSPTPTTSGMTMVGFGAGQGAIMTTAANDVGIGSSVMTWLTSGSGNACGGYQACEFLTTGAENSAWGFEAGQNMTTAFGNTLSGWESGTALTTGQNNDLYGLGSGSAMTIATGNNFFGRNTGKLVTGQGNNSLFGDLTGASLTAAASSMFGAGAGALVSTGANNSIFGYQVASTVLTTGSNNLILGTSASCTTPAAGTVAEIILCASGGPAFTVTGAGTPATSVTTIAGLANIIGATTLGTSGTTAGSLEIFGSTSGNITIAGGTTTPSLTFSALPGGTPATYACFTSGGQLISSASAC